MYRCYCPRAVICGWTYRSGDFIDRLRTGLLSRIEVVVARAIASLEHVIPDTREPPEELSSGVLRELASKLKHPSYGGGPEARIIWAFEEGKAARDIYLSGGHPECAPRDSQFSVKLHVVFAAEDPLVIPFTSREKDGVANITGPSIIGHFHTRAEALAFAYGVGRDSLPGSGPAEWI